MEIDSVHFYVTDATNTSNWFINCLGFQLVDSYQNDHTSTIAIAQKSIFLVISSPLNNHSPVAHYLDNYAEGIVDIAFRVSQLQKIINQAQNCGIKILQPIQQKDKLKYACVKGWACLKHSLLEWQDDRSSKYKYYLLPDGKLRTASFKQQKFFKKFNLTNIDHIVLNVKQGDLSQAVNYYQSLFDFQIQQTFTIKTSYSGLFSQALIDCQKKVQFNINEPTTANSQIQEFIELNGGAGIQHLALKSDNLIKDIAEMRSCQNKGIWQQAKLEFLPIPPAYYRQLQLYMNQEFKSFLSEELQAVTQQEILLDWEENKHQSLLLQIFTQPIFAQPTFFLEFIERRQQVNGFGERNFQALFKAIEEEQMRNNLN